MFNPFIQFSKEHVRHLIRLNKNYLVCQEMETAHSPAINLLITDYAVYDDAEKHFRTLHNKKYAAIINLTHPKHLVHLEEAITSQGYRFWWTVIEDAEKLRTRLNREYKENLRRYVKRNTSWTIASGQVLPTVVRVIFGELYVCMRWGKQTLSVKFEEIAAA